MSLEDDILKYMLKYGSITPAEALSEFGCMRLSARIWNLKHLYGINIDGKKEYSKRRNGRTTSWKRYWVVKE